MKVFKFILVMAIVLGFSLTAFHLFARVRGDSPQLFGVSSYVIVSDSMSPKINAGDLVVIRRADSTRLDVGDIITFRSTDPRTFGETITHQIHAFDVEGNERAIITKGINLDSVDPTPVVPGNIKGLYWFRLPAVGYVVQFVQSDVGFLSLFVLPISAFIVFEVIHFSKLYKDYVKEGILEELKEKEAQKEKDTDE